MRERIQALEQAREEAVAVNQATCDMLLTKSHAIQGLSDGMIRTTDALLDTPLTPAQQSGIRAVQDAAQALIAIRYALDSLTRREANPAALTCAPFDLHRLLESSLDFFAKLAQEKGLVLLSCIHPNVPRQVSGEAGRLRQLLFNLLANAIEFTDTGTVALSAERMDADDAVVTLRFEVHDTGRGIEPKVLRLLLDRDSLSDIDTTRASDRPGLGLPVCKQLAAAMHGTIGAQSALHAGSSFWATVQLGHLESDEEVVPNLANLVDRRILIVDAIELNRTLCQRQFAARGLQVVTAADPEQALSQIVAADERGQPIGFIMILHQPPACDGLSLGQQLRRIHTTCQAKCILVTPSPHARSISYLAEKLFAAHLHTPLHESKLIALIAGLATMAGSHQVQRLDAVSEAVPSAAPGGLRILLVEDNHVNQRVAVSTLRKWRHHVDVVENGLEALEAVRQHTYDLVLMDIQMPEMDGVEATKQIRQLEGKSVQVPIVAMTANAVYNDRKRILETGMNDYLPKPISPDRLQAILQRYACGEQSPNPEVEPPSARVDMSTPLLGDDVLGCLLEEFSRDAVVELIEDYTSHAKNLLSQVLTASEAGDMGTIEYAVHTLKGMSGALGALRLAQACQEILAACRNQQANDIESQLKDLPGMAQETQRALEEWCVRS